MCTLARQALAPPADGDGCPCCTLPALHSIKRKYQPQPAQRLISGQAAAQGVQGGPLQGMHL